MTGSGLGGQPLLCSWTKNYAGHGKYSLGLQVEGKHSTYQLVQYFFMVFFITFISNY